MAEQLVTDNAAALRVGHPLADWVGETVNGTPWVATESRSRVIGFTRMRANLLATAVDQGRRPILITDELSALTPAFAQIWQQGGGSWVVRTARGGLYDGFTGARLTGVTDCLSDRAPSTPDEVAEEFWPSDEAIAGQSGGGVQLITKVRLRHTAREETLLGRVVETWSEQLLGAAPEVWDTHEPLGRRWDRHALTETLRDEMPGPVTAIVGGSGLTATVTAERTETGVDEETTIVIGLADVDQETLERLRRIQADLLRQLAASAMPVAATQLIRLGGAELIISPQARPPHLPMQLLLGPPAVRELKIDVPGLHDQFSAEQVGRPRIPGLLFDFGLPTIDTWARVDAILSAVDHEGALSSVLGPPTVQYGGSSHA
ncbi:DUF6177 family protein [Propionibacteriaceae bacterium Y1685]